MRDRNNLISGSGQGAKREREKKVWTTRKWVCAQCAVGEWQNGRGK